MSNCINITRLQVPRPHTYVRSVTPESDRTVCSILDSSDVIGLQLDQLEGLLCKTVLPYCNDNTIRQHCVHLRIDLAERLCLNRCEIHDAISVLLELLNCPGMPCEVVAYIHSTIGLLYLSERETKLAIQYLTKALWIETTHQGFNRAKVSLTLHRLAICETRLGGIDRARALLNKAICMNETAILKRDLHQLETVERQSPGINYAQREE